MYSISQTGTGNYCPDFVKGIAYICVVFIVCTLLCPVERFIMGRDFGMNIMTFPHYRREGISENLTALYLMPILCAAFAVILSVIYCKVKKLILKKA